MIAKSATSHRKPSISGQGFLRRARLLTPGDFRRVFDGRPKRSSDRFFTMLLVGGSSETGARLGLAVSKKQARRSVDRNRLKRLIREAFRRHRATLPDLDIVVMVRAKAVTANNRVLQESLDRHFAHMAKPPGSASNGAR